MPDSQLNGAERALQQPFRNSLLFNGLLMMSAVGLAYLSIRALPDLPPGPPASSALSFRPVTLPPASWPLRVAGAWEMQASDRRFGGLSALAIDGGRFLTVSDRGAVARFSRPFDSSPNLWVADLRDGPRPWGEKWARDAESLAGDPQGRGWWVGYEQSHSLWLYDPGLRNALSAVDLRETNWPANRGAEGLLVQGGSLLALAEGGADAVRLVNGRPVPLKLYATTSIADAARAPDGSAWILTRLNGLNGIEQSIAPLVEAHDGNRVGMSWPVPKAPFDNYEGMAIEARPEGGWRFWLVTDDGHRFLARNLLVALDLELPIRHRKSPARRTGLSNRRKP